MAHRLARHQLSGEKGTANRVEGICPESQDQMLFLSASYLPYSLDTGEVLGCHPTVCNAQAPNIQPSSFHRLSCTLNPFEFTPETAQTLKRVSQDGIPHRETNLAGYAKPPTLKI